MKTVYKDSMEHRMSGHIRIFPKSMLGSDKIKPVYAEKNVIVSTVKSLFARMMSNSNGIWEPRYGVWGLAVGQGDGIWTTPPGEQATQWNLVSTIVKQPLSSVNFVDANYNPLPTGQYYDPNDVLFQTVRVDFQTELMAPNNIPVNAQIREMGLIGGGSTSSSTNMSSLTTPYWNPASPNTNSVTLINYKTIPPLSLPPDVPFIFSWVIAF